MRWALVVVMTAALGCGSSEPPTSSPAAAAASGGDRPPIGRSEGRWHHFWAVTEARDAIVRGDLPAARALLSRFSEGDVGENYPTDWAVFVDEIGDEADRAPFVKGRLELARIVSGIAARCGECHRSNSKVGPQNIPIQALKRRAHARGGGGAAGGHRWALEELWLGMTIPNHQAWVAGARALIDSPLHAPPPDPDEAPSEAGAGQAGAKGVADDADRGVAAASVVRVLPEGTHAEADAVAEEERQADRRRAERLHELAEVGEGLFAEGRPLPMARAYAELITRCADCHRAGSALP